MKNRTVLAYKIANLILEHKLDTLGAHNRFCFAVADLILEHEEKLMEACKAYLKDHNDDIAHLCRDAGIQPSACDCDLCNQARAALRDAGVEEKK